MKFDLLKWKHEYAESVANYANNKKIADNLRNVFPYPYTIDDAKWYVNNCAQNTEENQLCRAIVVDGEAVGSIGVFVKDDVYCKSAELGYWLGEPFWNKGIMTEAISRICSEAFKKYDIVRIFAEPFAVNIGSRRVLEKSGFTLEGILKNSVCKNGVIIDSCMYALCK
jgi:ribosomal-protein-alanine N-acetyltransferase